METLLVLTALARVAARPELVHGQGERLVGLLGERAERHGSGDEVLHDALHGLHLADVDGVALEVEEVADEDGAVLLVGQFSVFLEVLEAVGSHSPLQGNDGLRVPGMADAVLAVVELSLVGKQVAAVSEGHVVEGDGVASYGLQSDTANGGDGCAEIVAQQTLRESHALKNLCTAVGAYGGDAHLGHDLQQAFLDGFDIVGFGGGVVFLYLLALDEVVEDGIDHVGT